MPGQFYTQHRYVFFYKEIWINGAIKTVLPIAGQKLESSNYAIHRKVYTVS